MKLYEVRKAEGHSDIPFGAGLPDALVEQEVVDTMVEAVKKRTSVYLKYDPKSKINEEQLTPGLAAFHEKHFGVSFRPEEVKVSAGSTPVLASMAYITQQPGHSALVLDPSYPLIRLPVERRGGKVDRTARLKTRLDLDEGGEPVQDGRWHINYNSVKQALEKNRETGKLLYLNFPSNPTGYSPTPEEYKQLVELLLEDIKARQDAGLPTMAILEDIAYATMMHDGKKFYSIHNAIQDLRDGTTDDKRLGLLKELEQSVVVAHSFSKAFAVAGDRAGYFASKNPELLTAVYNQIIDMILTPSRGTLAAVKGALEKGETDHEAMRKYGIRLRQLEQGLNKVSRQWIEDENRRNDGSDAEFTEFVSRHDLVPAKADAGFFTTAFFNDLKGQKVDPRMVEELKGQIARIPNPTLHQEFSGIFEGGVINNAMDASLWLLARANVLSIPIVPADEKDESIKLRLSVGSLGVGRIRQALNQIEAAFHMGLQAPRYGGVAR